MVTCGEPMVLFSPDSAGPLRHVVFFRKYAAGAELNFSVALARLGLKPGYITRVGGDEFGQYIMACMRQEGLDTRTVKVDSSRPTGVYFKEYSGLGDPRVYYYRKGSAASALCPEEIAPSWLDGCKMVHLTGITPLLSDSCRQAAFRLLELAKANSAKVSFDPNIRLRMVAREAAREVVMPFIAGCDYLILNEAELEMLFGSADLPSVAPMIFALGPSIVALKMGSRGAAAATGQGDLVRVESFNPPRLLDPIGAGDGFDAGFIFGQLQGWDLKRCLVVANFVGASATTVLGDYEGYPYRSDVEALLSRPDKWPSSSSATLPRAGRTPG